MVMKFDMKGYQREYARKKRREARTLKKLLPSLYNIFKNHAPEIAPMLSEDELKIMKEVDKFVNGLG